MAGEAKTNSGAQQIAALWHSDLDTDITSAQEIMPGAVFHFDPDGAQKAHLTCSKDRGAQISVDVETPGKWLGLHFSLGDLDLSEQRVIGVYLESDAPSATTYRACIRSGRATGFSDCFFKQEVVTYSVSSAHGDLLVVENQPKLPAKATWRELVLFFRCESFHIGLQDVRVFVA